MIRKLIFLVLLSISALANEGVSTAIDASRLDEVMDWVENTKYTLTTERENISRTSIPYQEALYADMIKRILTISGKKSNEFLMRNILYRTQEVYKNLVSAPKSPKRDALARRFLEYTTGWALDLYEPDLNLIRAARENRLTETLRGVQFAHLGVQWAEYMMSLYYLAPKNEIKFQLMKDMMGLMYNDINNDDAVKRILAPISGAIATRNSLIPDVRSLSKKQQLMQARDLRRFMEQQLEMAKKILATYNVTPTVSAEPDASTITAASASSSYNESLELLKLCNQYDGEGIYAKQFRDTCIRVKPSLVKATFCDSVSSIFLVKAACISGTGSWNKYSASQADQSIAKACQRYDDADNQYQEIFRIKCMAAKPSIERIEFCDQASSNYVEKAACVAKEGQWAKY